MFALVAVVAVVAMFALVAVVAMFAVVAVVGVVGVVGAAGAARRGGVSRQAAALGRREESVRAARTRILARQRRRDR